MSMLDYEARFHELGRFTPELLSTEEDKMFLFLQEMNPDLHVTIRGLRCASLTDMVRSAIRVERGLIILRGLEPKRFKEMPSSNSWKKGGWKKGPQQTQSGGSGVQSDTSQGQRPPCRFCGRSHSLGVRCDGTPIICHTCGKPGHRASTCRSGGGQTFS
ncbi:hypothetical protein Dimus_038405 [Dionaea muscipula]